MKTAQTATIDLPPSEKSEQAVVVRQQEHVSLFGASEPVAIIERATNVATALKKAIQAQGLISNIQGKQYPRCEAWTLLGTMLGVFPVLCWTKPVKEGWEARVEARTRDGAVVGAAEAECLSTERNWSNRDDFAIRSMAQTRATAKALRMPLGFVMTLAGYEATPAEEMIFEKEAGAPRNSNTRGLNTLSGASGTKPAASDKPGAGPGGATGSMVSGDARTPRQPSNEAPARTVEPVKPPKCATAVTRQFLLDTFAANTGQVNHPKFLEYCSKAGMLTGTQTVEELSLCYVPVDKRQMDLWTAAFNGFVEGDPVAIPFKNPEPPPKPPKPNGADVLRDAGVGTWKDYPVPFGKNAGKKLSQLDRNQLAAYARMMDEECEFETYEDKKTGQTRKKSATSMATNRRFKEQLDAWRAEQGVESEAA